MRRVLLSILVVAATFWLATAPALAWPGPFYGEPTALTPGGVTGYYLWASPGQIHLRATSHAGSNTFAGRITTDGSFGPVTPVVLEHADHIALIGSDEIVFAFETHQRIDGLDFHVDGGTRVKFELTINGAPARPARIFMGHGNNHPMSHIVIVPR